jgi:hypothetical protein
LYLLNGVKKTIEDVPLQKLIHNYSILIEQSSKLFYLRRCGAWWNSDFLGVTKLKSIEMEEKNMSITYREAKRILEKQEEARDVINSYRGMETLGKRLQLRNNKELILKLFEIEKDDSIIEVFTHLKALYDEQWGDAEATAPPSVPGEVEDVAASETQEEELEESKSSAVAEVG